MNVFWVTFQSVATLLVVGTLGFWIVSRRLLPKTALGTFSTLALDVALPCFVFTKIAKEFDPGCGGRWLLMPGWWALFTLLAGILTTVVARLSKRQFRREFAISLFFQNAVFFPLIILSGMFPGEPSRLVDLFLFTLFFPALFFTTCHLFYRRKGAPMRWNRIFSPVFVATVAAVLLRLFNWHDRVPGFVYSAAEMVGAMAAPTLLLILGGSIYVDWCERGELHWGEVIKFTVVKNFLFPAIVLGLIWWIEPARNVALLLLLQSAVPPLTSLPIVTDRDGGDRNIVNQYMLGSCLFSLVSIPLAVFCFEMLMAAE